MSSAIHPSPPGVHPVRQLHPQLLLLLALIVSGAVALLWVVTDHRLGAVARASGQEWSDAMAQAAASASTEALAAGDLRALGDVLREMATLPGVLALDVQDAHGQTLLAVRADGKGQVQALWRLSDPGTGRPAQALPPETASGALQSWASVGPQGGVGRVGVTFALSRDRAHIEHLRWDALAAIALTGLLTMLGAHLLLRRTLGPVADLLAAVRSSESRMAAVFDAAPDAIVGFDAQGLITSASPAVASIFGREAHELPGLPITDLLPELDTDGLELRALAGQYRRSSDSHVAQWETLARRHGGTLFPAEVSLARINGPTALRYTCVVRDNTERHLAEELLQLYGQALECASNGIVISDVSLPRQPVFYVNPAFEDITGYSAAETVGRNCGFLQGADRDQPEVRLLVEAVARGESIKVLLRNYRKDGSLFFNELAVAPVAAREGTAKHYVGVINDVTERERARLAVAEHNARLNAVFDLSPDGFVVFDREQQLVFVNQAFLAMTGWEPDIGVAGLSLYEFDQRLRAMHDPRHNCPPLSMERGDEHAFDTMDLLHLQLPRPRVLTRLVRHNAGGQGESILYFRDVTHETEVDRMKSEFLTTAAHELRTPMVSVFGFAELLLSRPVPEHKRRDVLETIHRQAALLINMVNELLDLARIEARQDREMRFEPCAVAALLHTAVGDLAGRVSPQHRVVIEDIPDTWQVRGDAEKLMRAMTNILSNAQKYSPQGGTIRVGAQRSDDERRIRIWVEDQGIGMTAEQLERVFERFYRADPSGNIPGTGLGMCLVKEIVELHNGEVELHSAPGVGTRVTLHLPAAQRVPDSPAEPAPRVPALSA